MAKKNKNQHQHQHSNYWMGGHAGDDYDLAHKGSDRSDILKLAGIKNAVSNFVKIVTGRNDIPVVFNSGKDSYTTGDVVVISASTKEKNMDAVVGLALHESTHCVWPEPIHFLRDEIAACGVNILPQSLCDMLAMFNANREAGVPEYPEMWLLKAIKNLMNVFEDRRIDWWLYREAPGYRPYYEALYKQYWHNIQIDCALQQGMWNTPTIDNYLAQLTNMTNRWFDSRSLPGMPEIYNLIDVENIKRFDGDPGWKYSKDNLPTDKTSCDRLVRNGMKLTYDMDRMPGIFQLAVKVLGLILDNAVEQQNSQMPDQGPGMPPPDPDMEDNVDISDGGIPGPGEAPDDDSDDDDSDSDDDSEGSGSGESDEDEDSKDSGSGDSTDEDSDDSDSDGDDDSDSDGDDDSDSDGDGDDDDDDSDSDSSDGKNDDSGYDTTKHADPLPNKISKINEKVLDKALEKQQDFLDHNCKKSKITTGKDKKVTAMQQSGASMVEVEHGNWRTKTNVVVMRKLTQSIFESGAFPFANGLKTVWSNRRYMQLDPENGWKPSLEYTSQKAVTDGIRVGRVLAARLAIRNQNQVTKFNRRSRGKIDKRRLANLGHGDDSVFYKLRMTEYQPVLAHISLDASGSMHGSKWGEALMVGVAVATAAETIDNLDLVLSMRAGTGDHATIAIIYDSREDNLSKIKKLFPYITTAGNTPEGLCFSAIMDDLTKEQHGDRYFINLSDGMPNYSGYGGDHALNHTREQVNLMKASGLNILSYLIGARASDGFKKMYGNDASFIDVSKIAGLVKTLNALFLVR